MTSTRERYEPAILVDHQNETFKVRRSNFVDPEIVAAEKERIFERCWLYVGHGSEIAKPGDYVTRDVAGRTVLLTRDAKGQINALLNTCPHRGMRVCRERKGNAKSFQCFYHGWIFGLDGKLRSRPGDESYGQNTSAHGTSHMTPAPRLESYRDLYFIAFDPEIVSLSDYLAGAKEFIDVICDQASDGMAISPGTQEYSIRANWKLLCENSLDGYHVATTHATYLDYLGKTAEITTAQTSSILGSAHDLGNGHSVIEYPAPWGRPVAQWIPAWGEAGRAEIDHVYADLVRRHGTERANRIAKKSRNLFIFPNLVINDIMAVTLRTFYPTAPDYMVVNAWSLAPKVETDWLRKARLFNFLEFLGPGGFATPDDAEALEQCQYGFANAKDAPWNDISKGMNTDNPSHRDELQMRVFWTQWNRQMFPAPVSKMSAIAAA